MKTWSEFVSYRENEEDTPPLNPSDMDENGALFRMTRLAWKNHRDETVSFFKKLAITDPELAAEYERLGDVEALPNKKSNIDKDEIIPSMADTGVGLDRN